MGWGGIVLRSSECTASQVWVTKGEGLTTQLPTTYHHSQADGGQESSEGAEECSRQARRPPKGAGSPDGKVGSLLHTKGPRTGEGEERPSGGKGLQHHSFIHTRSVHISMCSFKKTSSEHLLGRALPITSLVPKHPCVNRVTAAMH